MTVLINAFGRMKWGKKKHILMHILGEISDPYAYAMVPNELSKPRLIRLD